MEGGSCTCQDGIAVGLDLDGAIEASGGKGRAPVPAEVGGGLADVVVVRHASWLRQAGHIVAVLGCALIGHPRCRLDNDLQGVGAGCAVECALDGDAVHPMQQQRS